MQRKEENGRERRRAHNQRLPNTKRISGQTYVPRVFVCPFSSATFDFISALVHVLPQAPNLIASGASMHVSLLATLDACNHIFKTTGPSPQFLFRPTVSLTSRAPLQPRGVWDRDKKLQKLIPPTTRHFEVWQFLHVQPSASSILSEKRLACK